MSEQEKTIATLIQEAIINLSTYQKRKRYNFSITENHRKALSLIKEINSEKSDSTVFERLIEKELHAEAEKLNLDKGTNLNEKV
ncbi:hypothetical protein IGK74_002283 [Enterococcus sp. AZ150]|uniref:hypothetical protein n=1 Tax=Enterococcus sp. AZ150 TaxID=2774866 RepID=UPI003F1F9DAB